MASDNSFDVVSKVELQEVKNAIDQATKEVNARFDLKNSKSKIELEGNETIQLASQDDYTLKAVIEILSQKLVKRGDTVRGIDDLSHGTLENLGPLLEHPSFRLDQGTILDPAALRVLFEGLDLPGQGSYHPAVDGDDQRQE